MGGRNRLMDAMIEIAGEKLLLLPERAIYWERTKTLLIADPHFGKSATFRAQRIPIPEGSLNHDLARLTQALTRTGAATLVVLGDLLHTAQGRDAETVMQVADWRNNHPDLQILLVRGNHDRHAGDPPGAWQMQSIDAPFANLPFVLSHFPAVSQGGYVLAGHLHPLAQLVGRGKQTLKLPCFWFDTHCGVLPAFGSFIDGSVIRASSGDQIFVIAGEQVMKLGK